MNRIPLKAEERKILGKKVKNLRRQGIIPAHVFGKKIATEHVSVKALDFIKVYKEAGETGLVDLKIGEEKVKPVLIRQVQVDPVRGEMLNIDFYQVNLLEKTKVNVPIILIGEEPEIIHTGEAVIIQPMMEIEVEALPTDLPENIEVDITTLKIIGDAITVAGLPISQGVTILAEPESVVVKLDNAVTEEMQKLLEEQAAEAAAATEAAATEAATEVPAGEEAAEGETPEGEAVSEEAKTEEKASASAEAAADKPKE